MEGLSTEKDVGKQDGGLRVVELRALSGTARCNIALCDHTALQTLHLVIIADRQITRQRLLED